MRGRVDLDGDAGQVGLGLHEDGGSGQAAVDPKTGQRLAEIVGDQLSQGGNLGGDAFQQGPHQMSAPAAQGHAGEGCGGLRVPPGGRETGQRRYAQHAAAAVPCRGRDRVELVGGGHQTEVDGPPHRRGGGVDLPVDAVGSALAQPPCHRGGQTGMRTAGAFAELGKQERTSAEGAFRRSGF